ncbi:S41 family peptidase [Selenomonas ruminantium]|uniref:Carboxyl-terminal processing protease n=1 Tax=Selenomonas ruminantium TaxID=971 RepID=A0A1I0WYK0_SELRU|nr:S41 family peptidase [Selenomonas ruminantium]SFA93819.1 carboxyl-terminal processing protease [Selenomonas ruminantium]
MSKKKITLIVVVTALASSFLTIMGLMKLFGLDGEKTTDLLRFFGVKRMIETRYVSDVDTTSLMDGAIDGMVKSLGDPHSIYMKTSMYKALKEHTAGAFGGIGVTMGFKDDKVTIMAVLEGTPGEKVGLKVGDEIMSVDGTPVTEYQPEEVALHIRGDAGTEVKLLIHRADEADKEYAIQRDMIKVPSAKGKMLDDGRMGYIRIASFGENTGDEFKSEYNKLKEAGMAGLIVDLRQNPGGLITSCVEVADMLVPKGNIVSVVQRDGSKEEYDSSLEESTPPIVVLIDGNSASASEILAGALQDREAATIVGSKSYGKGSVQVVVPLFHNDGLKLTIAKYYTPSGKCIDGIGIEPDITVNLSEGDTVDKQLNMAKEVLQKKMQ